MRKTSAVAGELVEDLEALGRREVEGQAALAPVGVLEQGVDVAGDRHTPVEARPRMASPRSIGLDLDDLGAPVGQQRRGRRHERVLGHLEDADALHHCGHGFPPSDPVRPGGGTGGPPDLTLTSTSTRAPRDLAAPARGVRRGLARRGATSTTTLPTASPSATWRRAAAASARSKVAPMSGHGPPVGQQVEQLALVARHLVGLVRREVAELEAEDVDPLQQHQVQGDAWDRARGVADRHEAAAPVQ